MATEEQAKAMQRYMGAMGMGYVTEAEAANVFDRSPAAGMASAAAAKRFRTAIEKASRAVEAFRKAAKKNNLDHRGRGKRKRGLRNPYDGNLNTR